MRTTLDLDEKLLDEVEEITGETSPSKAVNKAMAEFVRLRKLAKLRDLLGRAPLEDNWRELEKLELAEMRDDIR